MYENWQFVHRTARINCSMTIHELFEALISELKGRKGELRNQQCGSGRYVALCLTDVEKAQALFEKHVSDEGRADNGNNGIRADSNRSIHLGH